MQLKTVFTLTGIALTNVALADHEENQELYRAEDMLITSAHKPFPNTTRATPSFDITKEDIEKQNLITASDAVKTAPSVQVRRRFYGDTNGVTAVRGSTNFQSAQTNVYVDGIPIHNHVQTRWNGAPKWSLIAPNALDSSTVFYGPYSAEHIGGFGGTFDLKTVLPDDFEMSMDVTGIIQDSHRFGQDEVLTGHKEYISVGDSFGDFSILGFYNHLENDGQAQSFDGTTTLSDGNSGTAVTGGSFTKTTAGASKVIVGDRGINENIIDLYEVKMSYDLTPDLRALATVAFEDTERNSTARTYLRDSSGNEIWSGTVNQGGQEFTAAPNKRITANPRRTLMYGFNLSGELTDNWDIDTTASWFDNFDDDTYTWSNAAADSTDLSGLIEEKNVWWADYMLKLATESLFGNDDLGFMGGYQLNYSSMVYNKFSSDNVDARQKTTHSDSDGGQTSTNSAFTQLDWDFMENWNAMAGVRFDNWHTYKGHINNQDGDGGIPDRSASRFSPKASLAFTPEDDLSLRYSFSKAYRFPIVEELFLSTSNTDVENLSDSTLKPENGYFHDFQVRQELDEGYARVSFFYNTIKDEILHTTTVLTSGKTANRIRGVDATETIGAEFVYEQDYILNLPVGLNLNGTWMNKNITADSNYPASVGNQWPRIPKWRANGTLTHHTTLDWDNVVAVQYRSRQFPTTGNSENTWNVYGASDEYVLVNVKSSYRLDVGNGKSARFSVGIDNLLDENYYDNHPYPQRTYFARVGFDID
jgi:iron complex outermembrane receptor protein